MIRKLAQRILLIIIMAVTVSCKEEYTVLFPDRSCESPCWNGIMPGKTTEEELLADLKNIPTIVEDSIYIYGQSDIFDNLVCFSLPSKVEAEVYIIKDKVVLILFKGKPGITIGQVIEQIGQPEYIITNPTAVHVSFGLSLNILVHGIYLSKGIGFRYDSGKYNIALKSKITPERKLDLFYYFDPNLYLQLAETGMFGHGANITPQKALMLLQPWSGYGVIGEKYPPVDYKY